MRLDTHMAEDQEIALIREAAARQKVSQTQLAKVAGLPSQSAMSNIYLGKRELKRHEAAKLFDFLGIERQPDFQSVPLIGLASAGAWNEAVTTPARMMPIPRGIAGKDAFAVEIKGDSMNQLLPEGGWAVVDPDQRHLYYGRVYLIENDDRETTVKRYCGDPARFEPVSDNELHKPLILADTPYRVIGRIVSYGNTAGL